MPRRRRSLTAPSTSWSPSCPSKTSTTSRGAVAEAARALEVGGHLCLAVAHPLNSAGRFEGDEAGSPFVVEGSYLDHSFYADDLVRDGLEITLVSAHRPLHAYADALAEAGLLIERLREPSLPEHALTRPDSRRWQRLPLFLHIRALKPRRDVDHAPVCTS
jgi:hypothetical protein